MHAYRFSEETGAAIGEANYCGYANGSHWARGTAWAIYGFSIAYRYTGKAEYLDTAMKLLDKFMSECKGEIPVWDFRLPQDEEKSLDTSAAAVVLCGILEIEKHKTNAHLKKYRDLLQKKLEEYVDYNPEVMGVLKEQNGRHTYTPYGDYYMIESYMKADSDVIVW